MKMTGNPPDTEIEGIICIMPINTKYMFATFENCTNRFNGRNVAMVYLDVVMELSHTW